MAQEKADANESAYILYDENHRIEGFMYLKENDDADDINPKLPQGRHLKIGTFKFESKGTHRGQRFLKKPLTMPFHLDLMTYTSRYLINTLT